MKPQTSPALGQGWAFSFSASGDRPGGRSSLVLLAAAALPLFSWAGGEDVGVAAALLLVWTTALCLVAALASWAMRSPEPPERRSRELDRALLAIREAQRRRRGER